MGKSGSAPQMPPPDTGQQDEAMLQIAADLMSNMTGVQQTIMSQMSDIQTAQSESLGLPNIYSPPEINWAEKQDELALIAQGEMSAEGERRKGRMDTILTSPLLDEESAVTTGSLLSNNFTPQ